MSQAQTAPQINLTLGTAGHIDHGKSLLTKMLTGCETDTLREEKQRGMSIELGFAPCTVAGLEVGIVDVPGHEHFIKTMVAGATGMDAVILVVAADDGVMPQTREHLDILTLLGAGDGLVAITKIDRADQLRREQVIDQVRNLTHGTFLENAPLVPISSITGEGYDGLLEALSDLVRRLKPRSTEGVFRLPVERAFSVRGFGTVITGIPVAGSVAVGDEVVLHPLKLTGRVAGLQAYGRDASKAQAGQCVAVQVRHWDAAEIGRTCVLTLPGYFEPREYLTGSLRMLDDAATTLRHGMQVKLHTGTSETPATVYLLEGDELTAGGKTLAQFRLQTPLVAGPGDPYIIRSLTPVQTIGGGHVVEMTDRRLKRTRAGLVDVLRRRADAAVNPREHLAMTLELWPQVAAEVRELSPAAMLTPRQVAEMLGSLQAEGLVVSLPGERVAHKAALAALAARMRQVLGDYHTASPESPGLPLDQLGALLGLEKDRLRLLLVPLGTMQAVAVRSDRYCLPEHRPTFAGGDAARLKEMEEAFRQRLFSPPSLEELAETLKATPQEVRRLARLLLEHQRLTMVEPELYFHVDAVVEARRLVEAHIRESGSLESVKFKYLLNTTRKFAIPLLDHLDRIGFTQRVGYTRYLRR